MSPIKKGTKLTNNPKNVRLEIRLTQEESKILTECAERLGTTKTEIINRGVQLVKEELDKRSRFTAATKEHTNLYHRSFLLQIL